MNRHEKLEWLEQICSENFMKEEFVLEMVRWMGEDDFDKFYDHLCRNWDIARTPTELDAIMEGKHDQYDADSDTILQGSEEEEEDEEESVYYVKR